VKPRRKTGRPSKTTVPVPPVEATTAPAADPQSPQPVTTPTK